MLPPDVITGGSAWKGVIEQAFKSPFIDRWGRAREKRTLLSDWYFPFLEWESLTLFFTPDFEEFKKVYHFCEVQQKTETEFQPRAAFPSEILPGSLYLGKSSSWYRGQYPIFGGVMEADVDSHMV